LDDNKEIKKEQQTSYRQIIKATSIFGGVQVFNVIITIIRSKFIAILLGPAGMGIAGLLNSTIGLVGGLTNFGLGTSAVKDVAAAHATGNNVRISLVILVLRRLVWITGLLGMLLTIILSPWLSKLTFGNQKYTLAFIWLSITLLFNQLSSGQLVVLQGLRKLQYLAKADLTGSLLGLFISVPLYFFYGIDAIVPAIILTSLAFLIRSWYFSNKVKVTPEKISLEITFHEGKSMLVMGFMLSLNGLITLAVSYILKIYISKTGGIAQVGLYNAGFAIVNTYVGLVFTAMSTDYYPRLASVAHDNKQSEQLINQQAEIAILILAPIIIIFIAFIKWIIIILYSAKFLVINDMILWAVLGIFFKATSWPIAFIFLAKGESKLFFVSELIANTYLLLFNLLGYKFMGLMGLGISFLITYIIYLIQIYLIGKIKYNFSFHPQFIIILIVQLIMASTSYWIIKVLKSPFSFIIESIIIAISLLYSLNELDKRIKLKLIFQNLIINRRN
jgi:O-antigen/teichoic acid export membrane protein